MSKELIERLRDRRGKYGMNSHGFDMRLHTEAAARIEQLESECAELLAAVRNAKRTACLMQTGDGHEVVCIEPQLWKAIADWKGGAA